MSSTTDPTETNEMDMTKEELQPIRNNTIEELKSKLGHQELITDNETMIPDNQKDIAHHRPPQRMLSEDGLIIPRKPPNPVKESHEHKDLHRELLFNQKTGKNVLNQKSELQKAWEKKKDNMVKKNNEISLAAHKPELEIVIADRAKRLQEKPSNENEDDKVINKEFIQARMKLKNRNETH